MLKINLDDSKINNEKKARYPSPIRKNIRKILPINIINPDIFH